MAEGPRQSGGPAGDRGGFMQQFGRYSEIAFVLPAATLAGWYIGSKLDQHLHTDWLYIPGLILGIVAGFADVVRMVLAEPK